MHLTATEKRIAAKVLSAVERHMHTAFKAALANDGQKIMTLSEMAEEPPAKKKRTYNHTVEYWEKKLTKNHKKNIY